MCQTPRGSAISSNVTRVFRSLFNAWSANNFVATCEPNQAARAWLLHVDYFAHRLLTKTFFDLFCNLHETFFDHELEVSLQTKQLMYYLTHSFLASIVANSRMFGTERLIISKLHHYLVQWSKCIGNLFSIDYPFQIEGFSKKETGN